MLANYAGQFCDASEAGRPIWERMSMKLSMRYGLRASAGIAALAIAAPSIAQDAGQAADASDENVIVVTGILKSLEDSIAAKRDSDVIVDAVSAEDVGKFPDQNVAESLQRITGVAIDRSGGEGQFITVRGLGPEFNAVLLNGRTIATDNDGREFSFDVLSSDIIQTAEVYKSSQAGLQSGGIGAVVNIATAKPLDRPGLNLSGSAAAIYEDLSGEVGTDLSGVASWSDGTFGVLFGASYNKRNAQIDRNLTNGFALREGDPAIFAPETSTGLDATDIGALPAGSRVQQQVIFSRDIQDRERLTLNGALQYAPSDSVTITLDGLYSKFEVDSFDQQFSGFFSPPFIDPQVDANGTVVSFFRPSAAFRARNPQLAVANPQLTADPTDADVGFSQNDNVLTSNNREAETFAFGGNIEFQATETLKFVADAAWSRATRDGTNPFVVLGALAPTSPFIDSTRTDGLSTITNLSGLTDRSIQRLHFVNVNRTRVEDEVQEYRFDAELDVYDAGALRKLTAGAIHTDRKKTRDLFDNFADPDGAGPLSASDIFCAYCGYTVPFDSSILSDYNFTDFLSGVNGSDTIPATILTASFADAFGELNNAANLNNPNRTGGNTAALLAYANSAGIDPRFGIYTPTFNSSGSFEVDEQIFSIYANSTWGGELFGGNVPWTANLGLRVAFTNVTSSGFDTPVIEFTASTTDSQLDPIFGPSTPTSVDNSYANWLPSANLKLEPTDNTVLRLSYAKTVTRPTLTALGVSNTFGGRSNAPLSGGGNPFLEAFDADNFDISFEWYFEPLSYFSVAGFHKELGNFIQSETIQIPGQVRLIDPNPAVPDRIDNVTFNDTRERNGLAGSISGVEVAFQKTFNNGFGGILNYTYVTSERENAPVGDLGYNGFTPHTFNATAFYEKGPLGARVSYNYRDGFLVLGQAEFAEPRQREAFGQLDFSASFELTDQFQIFVEGLNVLGEDTRDFSRFPNRLLTYTRTGARYTAGVRATF